MLVCMKKHIYSLYLAVSAILALGMLTACSGGSPTETAQSATSAASSSPADAHFPNSARYVADVPIADGKIMAIGVAVDGDKVVAYACDGSTDEAWFFGSQSDGKLDITGKFGDTIKASYADGDVAGDLTMNGVAYQFTAAQVGDPAGMYTAALDGVRASWVVGTDGTVTGVQFSGFIADDDPDPFEVQQQLAAQVRAKRILQQAAQFDLQTKESTINGKPVRAELVTGKTTFG